MSVPALREISADARVAAFLDAQGEPREAIASAVGVSVTTVSRWRAQEEYQEEIERWKSREVVLITQIVERVHAEIAGAGSAALSVLVEALSAEKANGDPLWPVRLDAAKAILARIPPIGGDRDEQGARALAAVTLVVRRDSDGEFQVIEGEATEA